MRDAVGFLFYNLRWSPTDPFDLERLTKPNSDNNRRTISKFKAQNRKNAQKIKMFYICLL